MARRSVISFLKKVPWAHRNSPAERPVAPKLQRFGFEVVRIGEDWNVDEVEATVASYFEMLRLEASQQRYVKADFNAQLRQRLRTRSKGSVELKLQNISAVLHGLELPFITGYKPRSNAQLLLRQEVQRFLFQHPDLIAQVVDALEEVKTPAEQTFNAMVVAPPSMVDAVQADVGERRPRLPRKINWAHRDEVNRTLGRAGEQWAIAFEQKRLCEAGRPELFQKLEWVSDTLGDGTGYDILSHDESEKPRYIEVKTSNGGHGSSFAISRDELEFASEHQEAFYLYRIFQFGQAPKLYMLHGRIADQLHLEPIDYRASFRRLRA